MGRVFCILKNADDLPDQQQKELIHLSAQMLMERGEWRHFKSAEMYGIMATEYKTKDFESFQGIAVYVEVAFKEKTYHILLSVNLEAYETIVDGRINIFSAERTDKVANIIKHLDEVNSN